MKYKTPRALEQAVKAAAKKAPYDVDKAVRGFYFDRFLCRVFSETPPAFVIKGGQGMLARTVGTRATRDIDLLFKKQNLDEAVEELKRVASIDLEDFITYRFESARPIAVTQEYRDGMSVEFVPLLGSKAQQKISVDLVVDQVTCDNPDVVDPVNRLEIAGLKVADYLVYPIVCTIADKICAIIQRYPENRPSSRVKDLIDLVIILNTQSFEAAPLHNQIVLEHALRKMGSFEGFAVPESWRAQPYSKQYQALLRESQKAAEYPTVESAEELVRKCLEELDSNPAACWNPKRLAWE